MNERSHITAATCFAYDDAGNVCGKPATVPDPARGCFVCEEHRPGKDKGRWSQPALLSNSQTLNPKS